MDSTRCTRLSREIISQLSILLSQHIRFLSRKMQLFINALALLLQRFDVVILAVVFGDC